MRILHIVDRALASQGEYWPRIASLLREQQSSGFETFQLTSPLQGLDSVREEDIDGWHLYRTPVTAGLVTGLPAVGELEMMGELAHRIEQLARRLRPHVLHVHSPVLNAIPALRVGRRCDIPVVYEIHALWDDAAIGLGTAKQGSLRFRLARALETYAAKRADGVVTACEALKRALEARGVSEERIAVVPNGVDPARSVPDAPRDLELKQTLGLSGVVLGFAGDFKPAEGLDLLVAAMPSILRERPDASMLLVGSGPGEEDLRAQVRACRLEERVVVLGSVPNEELQRYRGLIDILVYARRALRPSEMAAPLPLLEAMAQGALVAVSAVGGHAELARGGETAALFSPDDSDSLAAAVLELLRHPERWPEMRTRARDHIRTQYSWSRCANGYLDLYARLGEPQRLSA